ncbi:MAG: hypothetical protein JXQ73_01630 [Phycisphaerae bacterium]|nr:hypothetical protein [Phycisphaerae bacterium]
MAIQFPCPSCQQPIEIDDVHGGRQVSCPYCHNVVTSPTESTLQVGPEGGQPGPTEARPLTPSAHGPQIPPSIGVPAGAQGPVWTEPIPAVSTPTPASPGRNLVGIVSIACGVAALGLYLTTAFIMIAHLQDLGFAGQGPLNQAEIQKTMMKLMEKPDENPWIMTMVMCFLCAVVAWAAGLICSIIGMSKRYRSHAAAIAGLILALVLPMLSCAGFVLG